MDPTHETRPWGTFSVIRTGESFKVKSLIVRPGKRLSMQYHDHRAEHWVVVRGVASVLVCKLGDERTAQASILHPGGSVYIPPKYVHRLACAGEDELEIIEVQTGDYLDEDDITRLVDDFGRV